MWNCCSRTCTAPWSRQPSAPLGRFVGRFTGGQRRGTAGGVAADGDASERVRGYRGGYLPEERRAIEAGLRSGQLLGVVATNALELGVDIGSLAACVLDGYPGTVAATRQQAGRAGRRSGLAAAVLVAGPDPLEQYLARHTELIFGAPPEQACLDPDNPLLLLDHLRCAVQEAPFSTGEPFGALDPAPFLSKLADSGWVHRQGNRWCYAAMTAPQRQVSLRTAGGNRVSVVEVPGPAASAPRLLGEIDRASVPFLLHEGAAYLHNGDTYRVQSLDLVAGRAEVRRVAAGDPLTRAHRATDLCIQEIFECGPALSEAITAAWGRVTLGSRFTLYKQVDGATGEILGWERLHLPDEVMETTACWFTLSGERGNLWPQALLAVAMRGLAGLLAALAPLFALCGPRDLRSDWQAPSPFTGQLTLYLTDLCPGGAGLAPRLYQQRHDLIKSMAARIRDCPCRSGCPSCIGPAGETIKHVALTLFHIH